MDQRRTVARNIGSLLVLQGTNYLLPLITFPYLVRVLGTDGYGTMAFAQAFAGYVVILTDYGFNLSATRAIAINRGDRERVNEIVGRVLAAKLFLLALGTAVFFLAILLFPRLRALWPVELAAFLIVIGNVLFPVWLFQGMARMGFITLLTGTTRALSTLAIFVLVKSESDVVLATALTSGGFVLAGILGLGIAFSAFSLRPKLPTVASVHSTLREGWHVFLSQASGSLFGNTNVFILGLFATPAVVGGFAVAEKIVRAVIGLSIPVTNAVYPVVSGLFEESHEAALRFLRRVMVRGGVVFLAASMALFALPGPLVELVAGARMDSIVTLVRIMSILPFTIFIDNIYGTQILLNAGEERRFMRATLYAGAFSVGASLILVPSFGAVGSAAAFTAAELLILILFVRSVHAVGIRLRPAYR